MSSHIFLTHDQHLHNKPNEKGRRIHRIWGEREYKIEMSGLGGELRLIRNRQRDEPGGVTMGGDAERRHHWNFHLILFEELLAEIQKGKLEVKWKIK